MYGLQSYGLSRAVTTTERTATYKTGYLLCQQWYQQMTSKTETKPTTTTTSKSSTIMSITKTSTTVAITMVITTLNTKLHQANYTYKTINRP
jgi:hypothetical protein